MLLLDEMGSFFHAPILFKSYELIAVRIQDVVIGIFLDEI